MPCEQCEDEKWKWGTRGNCKYDSKEECEAANKGKASMKKPVSAIDLMCQQHWAIEPEMLETIRSIAMRENESPEAVAAKLGRPLQNTRTVSVRDGVALIPVNGPIFRYANLFTEISGATSLEKLALDFNMALDDPTIKSIVLQIDSPGGQAAGIAEFAQMVHGADKPVTAYVDGMGASAAYWIAAAANELVINKSAEVGSIGAVFGVYKSRANSDVVEFVSSQSPMKRPNPESDAGRMELQKRIDSLAQVFIEDVAAYRGVDVETVLSDFGQGGVRLGAEAVSLGMADRISTLEEVIAGLAGKTTGVSQSMTTKATASPAADEKPVITRQYLSENHPDIVAAIENDAATTARQEGEKAGASAERTRIQGILATPLANVYGEIVTTCIEDGRTPEQAAVAILAAEGEMRTDTMKKHKADAPKPVADPAEEDHGISANATVEAKAKTKWDKDANLRAEFGDNFDTYLAFEKNNAAGKVKILGKKSA